MLQYLHINNWFDISQSLLLACDRSNIPRALKSFSFSHFFSLFHFLFLLLLLSFSPHYLSNHTPSPAGLSFYILCFHESTQSVCIFLFIYHQSQSVFWCIEPFYAFFCLCTCHQYVSDPGLWCFKKHAQKTALLFLCILIALASLPSFPLFLQTLINIDSSFLRWNRDSKVICATGHRQMPSPSSLENVCQ